MVQRRLRWVVLAMAAAALLIGLALPTTGSADGPPVLPTPSVNPRGGDPGHGGGGGG